MASARRCTRSRRSRISSVPRLRQHDIKLEPGLVLAIEPMVALGTKEVRTLTDGWTVETKDRRASAHFEHTVAMTPDGPRVLTYLED